MQKCAVYFSFCEVIEMYNEEDGNIMYKILIVDDEALVRNGLERLLGKIPTVRVMGKVSNGVEAKAFLEQCAVDAVISDIRMPLMDGLELAEFLSSYRPDCRVVLISAYTEFEYAKRALTYGVKDYLIKPIRFPEVKKIVEQLIDEQKNQQKKQLWLHDFKKEIQELEIFKALTGSSYQAEASLKKRLYFVEYWVTMETKSLYAENDDMLRAAWTNIFRWCAPLCIPVLVRQEKKWLRYVLLAEDEKQFPDIDEMKGKARELMETEVGIESSDVADASEIQKESCDNVNQEEILDEIIIKAKEYISDNISRGISRADVAEAVFLESSYFSKYFKKKVGMNFHDYLLDQRMQKVMELLAKGKMVREAAAAAGFQNIDYFNRVFKKYTGYSPTEYRRKDKT